MPHQDHEVRVFEDHPAECLKAACRRHARDRQKIYNAHAFAHTCRELGLRHLRTRPYTPRTNGKAERFIQTLLREWAYARPYRTSNQRAKRLARAITTATGPTRR